MDEMTLTLAAGLVRVGLVLDWDAFCAAVEEDYPGEVGEGVIAAVEQLLADARGVAAG